MKIGDTLTWTSQSQGYTREKTGTVVAVVPAGVRPATCPNGVNGRRALNPDLVLAFPALADYNPQTLGGGQARKHESYIFAVGRKLYWPHIEVEAEIRFTKTKSKR